MVVQPVHSLRRLPPLSGPVALTQALVHPRPLPTLLPLVLLLVLPPDDLGRAASLRRAALLHDARHERVPGDLVARQLGGDVGVDGDVVEVRLRLEVGGAGGRRKGSQNQSC